MLLRRQIASPEVGLQVLPAGVGEDHDDVALVEPLRELEAGVQHGAGTDAAEDAFALHHQPRRAKRVAAAHEDLAVEEAEVEDRRDEAVGEALQPL